MSKKIQRPISILTSITTIAWLSGIALLAPIAVGAAVVDGDIVSPDAEFTEGEITYYPYDVFIVKIVGTKTFKRLILNPEVFDSYGHLEWANIQTISVDTVDGYTTSDLVRELDDTKVYKLTPDGDVGTKGWMNMTAAEFEADGYDWDSIYVINVTDRDNYTTGSDVGDDVVVGEGTQLSVALASDTPAAGLAVAYEIRCPFTKINLTASSDGDITVDKMVIQRAGFGIDSDFDHLVLIDADTNLQIGLKQTLNSLHQSTFNDDFVVPAGTTKSIILAGNIKAGTPGAGNVPALSLVGITLKGDSVVNGTLPITGNTMTINISTTLGQIAVQNGAYENATTTNLKIGQTNYTISAIKVSANSTEDQNLEQIRFYQRGTAALGSDLSNFKLLLDDSTDLGATITVDGKYVIADFSDNPLTIAKGLSKEISLKADVLDGSLRTVQMGLYRTTDVLARGVSYDRYRVATYSGTGAGVGTIAFTSPLYTISTGTLRIDRGTSVGAENVAPGDDVVIGAFDFIVAGEGVNITSIVFSFSTATTNGIKNVKIVDSTGSAIWGPDDVTDGEGTVTFASTASLPVGTNVLTVKATLLAHSFTEADETFYAYITTSGITATGVTTGDAITATPSSVSASTMTVKVGALAVSRDALPAAGNVVLGQQDFLYGSWTLDAGNSGEDVRVTAIKVGNRAATTTNNDALTLFDMSVTESECTSEYDYGVWSSDYGCSLDPVKDGSSGTTTFSLTNPIIVTKGTSKNIQLRADVRTTADGTVNHTDEFGLFVDGTINPITAIGVSTGGSITASGVTSFSGALMTITAAGTLTINLDSATPSAKIVAAGETAEIARIKLTASNEAIDITQLILNLGEGGSANGTATASSDDVEKFYLYESGESDYFASGNIATGATTKTFNITKGILQVPKDTTAGLVIVVKAKFAGIGTGQTGESGADVTVGLGGTDGIKGYGVASGTVAGETHTQSTSSAMVLHLSRPVVSINTLASTKLQSGAIMFDFNVANDTSEPIALYRLSFWTATSDDINANGVYIQAKLDGEATFSTISGAEDGGEPEDGTAYETFTFVLTSKDATSETKVPYVIPKDKTARFQLMAGTIAGAGTLGEFMTTYFCGDTATSTAAADLDEINAASYGANNQGNFVWSDLHANSATHYGADSNATTTAAQWWNGYLVSGLQTTSSPQTLTY